MNLWDSTSRDERANSRAGTWRRGKSKLQLEMTSNIPSEIKAKWPIPPPYGTAVSLFTRWQDVNRADLDAEVAFAEFQEFHAFSVLQPFLKTKHTSWLGKLRHRTTRAHSPRADDAPYATE